MNTGFFKSWDWGKITKQIKIKGGKAGLEHNNVKRKDQTRRPRKGQWDADTPRDV